jgi:hypothetical protein
VTQTATQTDFQTATEILMVTDFQTETLKVMDLDSRTPMGLKTVTLTGLLTVTQMDSLMDL